MKQQALYDPTKAWLESKGFRVLITGDKTKFVISVSDLLTVPYMIPDLVGVDGSSRVAVAEVEKDKDGFFNALGRCMLWRCTATFVYLVYPKGEIERAPLLSRLGIGLLEIDQGSHAVNELISLPRQDSDLGTVWELHPTDPVKEQQLAAQIHATLG